MRSILNLIEDRKNYPVGVRGKDCEFDYISNQIDLDREEQYLILPQNFLDSSRKNDDELKKMLFTEWNLKAIFDLGSAWAPYTSIKLILVVLNKKVPERVFFSNYLHTKTFNASQGEDLRTAIIGKQNPCKKYVGYIDFIEKKYFLDSEEQNQTDFQFWSVPYSEVNLDYLRTSYYDPDLIENEKKLEEEETIALEEIVEILRPRKTSDKQVKVLKPKNLRYPLTIKEIPDDSETSVILKPGDIVFCDAFNGTQKSFLFEGLTNKEIHASSFLRILRPKPNKINSEYLFLYLQSETFQKYFKRYIKGGAFSRLNTKDLKSLPIIIPSIETQENTKAFFKTKFLSTKEDILSEINKQIFSKHNSQTPVQEEFCLELLQKIKIQKKEILQNIIEDDFHELEKAQKNKMYKSFFILAGSILEVFLLDWLSEEENHNYFDSEEEISLFELIKSLFGNNGKIPDSNLFSDSNYIRGKRNCIHPKKALDQKVKLKDSDCNQILKKLRKIFEKRGFK